MGRGVSLSKYYRSFSGTDTIAFLIFPGCHPVVIGSLTTISYSMYRNKVPVINIGRTNINGITRGSRVYAGTMVFTLINKHWIREIQKELNPTYLKDLTTIKTDELPLFDIMIVSANEYGSAVTMFIYGIDFTDESQVISVEDLFTENVFKFVSRDVSVFDDVIITSGGNEKAKYFTTVTSMYTNYIGNRANDITYPFPSFKEPEKNDRSLDRNLYLITDSNKMIGEDVGKIQRLLNIPVTYEYDQTTDQAVREFQALNNLPVDGIVDNYTYNLLCDTYENNIDNTKCVQVINPSGCFIYEAPDNSAAVVGTLPYLAQAEVLDETTNHNERYYQIKEGYLSEYDTYDFVYHNTVQSMKLLRFGDSDETVTVLQEILNNYYKENYPVTGIFDEQTENLLIRYQTENGLDITKETDINTWNSLISNSQISNKYLLNKSTTLNFSNGHEPGTYTIDRNDLDEELQKYDITLHSNEPQSVKLTTVITYKDGSTKTNTINDQSIGGYKTYSLKDFQNSFIDDPAKLDPKEIDYYIYPYGYNAYKYKFNIK